MEIDCSRQMLVKKEMSTNSLILQLKNRDVNIRRKAALLLGKQKATEAIIPLLESMRDGKIRDEATIAICNFGNLSLNPLLQLLKHPQPIIRMNAALVLGELKDPHAIIPLIDLLGDPSSEGFGGAYQALGKIGNLALDDTLKATRNPNPRIRNGAVFALGEIIQNFNREGLLESSFSIDELLAGEDEDEKSGEIDNDIDDDANDDEIVEVDDEDDEEECDDKENEIKSELFKKQKELVRENLLPLLKDKDPGVRQAASRVLGSIGMPSIDPITQNLKQENSEVRRSSIIALSAVYQNKRTPEAIPVLINALTDSDPEIRMEAAKGLRYSKDPRTLQPLINCLHDSNQEVRKEAAEGLRRRNDPKIYEVLLEALNDKYFRVRWTATCALGEIGNPLAKDKLMRMLKDENEDVRQIAAISLEQLKNKGKK